MSRHHLRPCRIIAGMTRGDYDKLRAELVAEQCEICPYCLELIPLAGNDHPNWTTVRATVDHVEPRARGGSDDRDNLVAACYSCNSRKKDTPLLIFLLQIARRRDQAGLPL